MSNDNHLQKAVIAALNWELGIKAAHIGVAANDGVVTLSGPVDTCMEKSVAEKAARAVKAVA
jgi:osmotically-inducible protein OsmY